MIPIPWGVGATFPVVLVDASTDDLRANPTLASGDFKISKDGGAFANLGTLPSVAPAAGVQVQVLLSAAECEFTFALVTAIDTATKEWKDNSWQLYTGKAEGGNYGKASGTPTTTTTPSTLFGNANDGAYTAGWITFLTGANAGLTRKVTGFTALSDTATHDAFPAAASAGDVFAYVNGA